jgi:hypothetical protein
MRPSRYLVFAYPVDAAGGWNDLVGSWSTLEAAAADLSAALAAHSEYDYGHVVDMDGGVIVHEEKRPNRARAHIPVEK